MAQAGAPDPGAIIGHRAVLAVRSEPDEPAGARPVTHVPEPAVSPPAPGPGDEAAGASRYCTQSQLRRFIKSRAYIPMHELRRRFALEGPADEMTVVHCDGRRVFVGLPEREGRMIADLVRQGEVGMELCQDPSVAVAVGVFPMRPVLRT